MTRLDRCLPVSGRGGINHGLRTAIDPVDFARARFLGVIGLSLRTATDPVGITLGVTVRGLLTATGHGESIRDPMFAREVAVTGRSHAIPLAVRRVRPPLASDCSRSGDRSWRARHELRESVETVAISQAPVVSEASAAVAPPVVGGTVAAFQPAVQDLARFFLSLAGSLSQGAVVGAASATVPVPGVGVPLFPSAPGGGAVTSCDCDVGSFSGG